MVGQVDYTGLADGHLHVGEVVPSGEMNSRPARHLFRSDFPLQLLILCSHYAFGVLESLSGAPVGSNVDGHYILLPLDGGPEPPVEAAAIAAVPAGRSGA